MIPVADALKVVIPPFEVTILEPLNEYFLQGTAEQDELYLDPKAGPQAGLAGRPAPPTSLFGPTLPGYPWAPDLLGARVDRTVMASASYEIERLPLVGEVLTCRGRCSDAAFKQTSKGQIGLYTLESIVTDATGAVVLVERLSFLERALPAT
ncbi:MAG TPA: MaoC family dehydratase N-terminal domain-containing protein [Streptosporangiaceae bacterium]|jgi:hypothetical protein